MLSDRGVDVNRSFRWEPLKACVVRELGSILDSLAELALTRDAKTLNALLSLLQNVAVHLSKAPAAGELKTQAVSVMGEVVGRTDLAAADALLAVGVLGTLVHGDTEARSLVVDLDIAAKLSVLEAGSADATVKRAVTELLRYCAAMETGN